MTGFIIRRLGQAVLVTLGASLGVLSIAHGVVRLSPRYHRAGRGMGWSVSRSDPRAGVAAGLMLALAYTTYAVVTATAASIFTFAVLRGFGLGQASRDLLILGGGVVLIIAAICGVVLANLIAGHHPDGGGDLALSAFAPVGRVGASRGVLGVVFGSLAFAGFEAATTHAREESANPRRDMPIAVQQRRHVRCARLITARHSNGYIGAWPGDPAGIGPEICIKARTTDTLAADILVVGDLGSLQRSIDDLGAVVVLNPIDRISERAGDPDTIDVLAVGHQHDVSLGQVSATCGAAAAAYIEQAVTRILDGQLHALVTAPVNKEALSAAGIRIRCPRHTEMLAGLSGVEHVAMMLYNHGLRVVLVTAHVSLQAAIALIDVDAELLAIRMAASIGPALGLEHPRIAVAGLNPHAGESGMFGDEDQKGHRARDPRRRRRGDQPKRAMAGRHRLHAGPARRVDLVIAQYHDQGLIPIKYLRLDQDVNVTLGLPFIRASVEHGTAFAIAGEGRASAASLVSAIHAANELTVFRRLRETQT